MPNEKVPEPNKKDLKNALTGIELESNRAEKFLTPEEAAALCDKIQNFNFGVRDRTGSVWNNLCEDFEALLDLLPQNTFGEFQEEWRSTKKFLLFRDQANSFITLNRKLETKISEILSSTEKSEGEVALAVVLDAFSEKIQILKGYYNFPK